MNTPQEKMKALLQIAIGSKSISQVYREIQGYIEKNPGKGFKMSKQYIDLILAGHAPDNPTIKSLTILHEVLNIPFHSLRSAYGLSPALGKDVETSRKIIHELQVELEKKTKLLDALI